MRAGLRVALAGCGMMLAGATTGPAQDAKQAPSPPFRLEMNVDRLLVPVVVRDRQGHIINDLKQEDFQVFDNNKVRPVSRFTVERRGATVPACNQVAAFMNQVEAQAGKSLTRLQANQLLNAAAQIRAALGCR